KRERERGFCELTHSLNSSPPQPYAATNAHPPSFLTVSSFSLYWGKKTKYFFFEGICDYEFRTPSYTCVRVMVDGVNLC
ncbi:hypothetical protein D0Y65_030492, partial [Glycine soja]